MEVFFRALKQNLRVKTFVGTSLNAVRIQIWTALIALLLIKFLQLRATYGWSLSNLVALLRQQLFVYRDLWTWLKQLRATYGWSLSNLVALLRQQLFVYRDLWTWLNEPYQPPPQVLTTPDEQLPLAFV